MKLLLMFLAICAAGYLTSHWQEISAQHSLFASTPAPKLIIYGHKSSPETLRLQSALSRCEIPFQKRSLDKEADVNELMEKLALTNRAHGNIVNPVADVDGVLITNATIDQILRQMK